MSSVSSNKLPWINKLIQKIERVGRVYIIPTRFGVYFLIFVLVLFLFSLTYGHSMAFSATFLFLSLLMSSAIFTNANVGKVELTSLVAPALVFEDQPFELDAAVFSAKEHLEISLCLSDKGEISAPFDIKRREQGRCKVPVSPLKRGEHSVDRVTLSTQYPARLFYAWTTIKFPLTLRILPRPVNHGHLPRRLTDQEENTGHEVDGGREARDFFEHRPYRDRESWRGIDWKVFARRDELFTKHYDNEEQASSFIFDYFSLGGLTHEQKLQQLMHWILDAEARDKNFQVRLPGGYYYKVDTSLLHELATCEAVG
jgi:uncharacterized protein (DUF58 family)